jgi:histidinol dehydrogenase
MVRTLDARGRRTSEVVAALRRPRGFLSAEVRGAARGIMEDVQARGDEALLEYTERFDGLRPDQLRVPGKEIERARASLPAELEESFLVAFENVRSFHERELDRSWELSRNGATVGQRVRPLRRVGVYVPGGHGAYPSTLMMAAIPAQVAGVREICVCTRPDPTGGRAAGYSPSLGCWGSARSTPSGDHRRWGRWPTGLRPSGPWIRSSVRATTT